MSQCRYMRMPVLLASFVSLSLVLSVDLFCADDCEIVSQSFYERTQGEISADWHAGIPYRRYEKKTYPCVSLTVKNTSWLPVYSSDIEITATFQDQKSEVKRFGCDRKRLEFGEAYSCSVCFESDSSIENVRCTLR